MTMTTHRCAICGVAVVPADGLVCPLHLRASEQRLLTGQEREPSAWVLAAKPGDSAYSPPPGERDAEAPREGVVLAGFEERLVAFIIDLFAATVIAAVLMAFFSESGGSFVMVVGLGSWWGYFLLSNSLGQLAGKATLSLKVIDPVTGREPGFAKGTLRTIGMAMSLFLTLGFGFLMMVGDRRKMTIHDHMAGTIVVRITVGGSAGRGRST